MSHDSTESSARDGAPVELYHFLAGGVEYTYTSGDTATTYAGDVYATGVIRRGAIRHLADALGGELEVRLPLGTALADLWDAGIPLGGVDLTVYRKHRSEATAVIIWLGEVRATRVEGRERVLRVGNAAARLARRIPRLRVGRTCANVLYDELCQLVPTDFDFEGTVAAVSGRDVTVTGLGAFVGADDGYLVGGVLLKAGVVKGYIAAQDAGTDTITLLDAPTGIAVSDTVVVYAGCDLTIDTCLARFNNVLHFNGFHAIPSTNPATGQGLRRSGVFQ